MTQTEWYSKNRSELFWDAMRCVSGPIHDSGEVTAIVQLMDGCGDLEALQRLGRRVAQTDLAECDREALRGWYRECAERLASPDPWPEDRPRPRINYWTDENRPASSAQRYFLVKHGAWVDGMTRSDAARAIRRVAKDMRARK